VHNARVLVNARRLAPDGTEATVARRICVKLGSAGAWTWMLRPSATRSMTCWSVSPPSSTTVGGSFTTPWAPRGSSECLLPR